LVTIASISTAEPETSDIIEHPDFANPQPVLWPANAAEAFDATSACLCRLISQMNFKRLPNGGSHIRFQNS
jgi:hypothetical protein